MSEIPSQIAALEALRLQRKGAVDLECEAIQKRLEALEKEAQELVAHRNQLVVTFTTDNAKIEGKLELLREQAEGKPDGNNPSQ